jgi:hypothetical protein
MSEDTYHPRGFVQKLYDISLFAFLHHAKAAIEANVSHDIEAVEVHPIADSYIWLIDLLFQPRHESKGMTIQTGFVFA